MSKTLKLNKGYAWDTISSTYPDMYALITNVKMQGGAIKTCTLLDVCTFDEKAHYVEKYLKKGIEFSCERTTFLMPTMGALELV